MINRQRCLSCMFVPTGLSGLGFLCWVLGKCLSWGVWGCLEYLWSIRGVWWTLKYALKTKLRDYFGIFPECRTTPLAPPPLPFRNPSFKTKTIDEFLRGRTSAVSRCARGLGVCGGCRIVKKSVCLTFAWNAAERRKLLFKRNQFHYCFARSPFVNSLGSTLGTLWAMFPDHLGAPTINILFVEPTSTVLGINIGLCGGLGGFWEMLKENELEGFGKLEVGFPPSFRNKMYQGKN